jgi:erythronate-4-phosphate dehydrogenase
LLVVADENIPYAREVFGRLGEVRLVHGRRITRDVLRSADLLFVRSITPVEPPLLDNTRVGFLGTATIGTDHINEAYLASRSISFASAPGSNANSVAEYMVAALLVMAERRGFELAGKTIGIVGVGNVGSRVAQKVRALGMTPLLNDPPIQRVTGEERYRPLDELLGADVLTFHVPLTQTGEDATLHLCDAALLGKLRPGCIVINTSRGPVVDGAALREHLARGRLSAVLDVWEGEPDIDADLLGLVSIATPHIAGYSLDGKVNGTLMIYRAACEFLGIEPERIPLDLPVPEPAVLHIDASGRPPEDVLREAVLSSYDILRDDAALRRIGQMDALGRGSFFDRLRKEYPVRREFPSRRIVLRNASGELAEQLKLLGFRPGDH